jgi:hypothetical protein
MGIIAHRKGSGLNRLLSAISITGPSIPRAAARRPSPPGREAGTADLTTCHDKTRTLKSRKMHELLIEGICHA